eukprot:CAMPEP_0171138598 /NCGR_PEP_ID=MMETSP0766_2-20121228/135343_1 /TAXON_ID=439317 /ORGANISM="Gambierdiscus australes, Strain CAWD 149" /LENGTH=41 /DNA_ID= /DNA_START= /DNA_END= /DNA_ORIENTATION=
MALLAALFRARCSNAPTAANFTSGLCSAASKSTRSGIPPTL